MQADSAAVGVTSASRALRLRSRILVSTATRNLGDLTHYAGQHPNTVTEMLSVGK
jgi:hypothetical protein